MTPAPAQINLTGFLERNAGAFSKLPAATPLQSVASALRGRGLRGKPRWRAKLTRVAAVGELWELCLSAQDNFKVK